MDSHDEGHGAFAAVRSEELKERSASRTDRGLKGGTDRVPTHVLAGVTVQDGGPRVQASAKLLEKGVLHPENEVK